MSSRIQDPLALSAFTQFSLLVTKYSWLPPPLSGLLKVVSPRPQSHTYGYLRLLTVGVKLWGRGMAGLNLGGGEFGRPVGCRLSGSDCPAVAVGGFQSRQFSWGR